MITHEETIADLRNRLGTLYNRVTILENNAPPQKDIDKVLKMLKKSEQHIKAGWMLLTEIRRMIEPEAAGKRTYGYQDTPNGEQCIGE